MTLYETLKNARSEEDVKDAYIKALGLKSFTKGELVPPFLCVIDMEKAAIMKSADVLPFLEKKTIKWGQSASKFTLEARNKEGTNIAIDFSVFKLAYDGLGDKLRPMVFELGFLK
jgi:hypothetical protein